MNESIPSVLDAGRTLLIDNYDSFTYNLLHLLRANADAFGETVLVRNDEFADWGSLDAAHGPFARIVLSPGPGNPLRSADFGLCRAAIEQSAVPVLGVCLGHQGIGAALGARVVRAAAGPMHGRLERVTHSNDGAALFAGVPTVFTAVRYHSLELEPTSLPPLLRATAWASDGRSVMAVESADGRLHGLQFHPESICSEHGATLLRNFAAVRISERGASAPATPSACEFSADCSPVGSPRHCLTALDTSPAECSPARSPPGSREAPASGHEESASIPVALLVEEIGGELAARVAADPADAFVRLHGQSRVCFWLDSASRSHAAPASRHARGAVEGGAAEGRRNGGAEGLRPQKRQAPQPSPRARESGMEGGSAAGARPAAMSARCSMMGADGGSLSHLLAVDACEGGAGCSAFDRISRGLGRCTLGWAGGGGAGGEESAAAFSRAHGSEAILRCAPAAAAEQAQLRPWPADRPLPFGLRGGYVGYIGYEMRHDARAHDAAGSFAQRLPQPAAGAPRAAHVPDACLLFAQRFVAIDHGADDESGGEHGADAAGPRLFLCHLVRRNPAAEATRASAEPAAEGESVVSPLAAELGEAADWFRQTRALLEASAGAAERFVAGSGAAPLRAPLAVHTCPNTRRGRRQQRQPQQPRQPPQSDAQTQPPPAAAGGLRFRADRSRACYLRNVSDCLEDIAAGESYEVCLTNQLRSPLPLTAAHAGAPGRPQPDGGGAARAGEAPSVPVHPLALYLHLRLHNPAPNGAFLLFDPRCELTQPRPTRPAAGAGECGAADGADSRSPALAVLCSSPERMLKVCAQPFDEAGGAAHRPGGAERVLVAECKPIKGTARRAAEQAEDCELAERLRCCEKERSENLMIVDLVRNDLSRVALAGSVHVPVLMAVESYRTVHQLVSTVRATLSAGKHALDALAASFPGGSMTGAPKVRTLEIIHRCERAVPRGVYSGALGFLSLGGTADLAIVIRTAVLTPAGLAVGAGGAITALSEPEAEYAEMRLKAAPVLGALARALGGDASDVVVDDAEEGERGDQRREGGRATQGTSTADGPAKEGALRVAAAHAATLPSPAIGASGALASEQATAHSAAVGTPRPRGRGAADDSVTSSTIVSDALQPALAPACSRVGG